MFERFTPRARRVIVLAQDAARDFGHPQIKPEHLLVGLKEGEGMASNAMAQSGVDSATLRQHVAERYERKASAKKVDKVPFSAEGKKALELSLRAAVGLGHNYIGTEHIFFGVQREAEQRGQTLDGLLGVSTADVRDRLTAMISGATAARSMRSPAVETAMNSARRQAGPAPITTGLLLTAILGDPDSQAARALGALGVRGDAVHAALANVAVADSSDATPSAQNVSITIGDSTRVIGDPEIAAALERLSADQLRDAIRKAIGLSNPGEAAR